MDKTEFVYEGNSSKAVDVLLLTGDAFVDHPAYGVAIVARHLQAMGFRVGILSHTHISAPSLHAFGKPRLFVGITSGNLDSMVSNYTASQKKRRTDDLSFSDSGEKRPDRAVIVYANLVKRVWKDVPIVLGGIEASLRRFGHYDWWQDKVRHSILLDSKADFIFYGMAERTLTEAAGLFAFPDWRERVSRLRGVAYTLTNRQELPSEGIRIPSFEEVSSSKEAYSEAFRLFYQETDPIRGKVIYQTDGTRAVVQNLPSLPLETSELDRIYGYPYTRELPEFYRTQGLRVKGVETVRFSITGHRGCYGSCAFCAIGVHQGRTVTWRSETSIINEAKIIASHKEFKGYISDVGGPTANMYGYECEKKIAEGACKDRLCLHPEPCPSLNPNHETYLRLLNRLKTIPGVKRVFISSGIRPDLVLADSRNGDRFLNALVESNVSGQLKIAPEHVSAGVLREMRKYPHTVFKEFTRRYALEAKAQKKDIYLVPYLLVAHPGEGVEENEELRSFVQTELGFYPEQIQIFTPTPSTLATTVYHTGFDPWTKEPVFSEKSLTNRNRMKKRILTIREGKAKHGDYEGACEE